MIVGPALLRMARQAAALCFVSLTLLGGIASNQALAQAAAFSNVAAPTPPDQDPFYNQPAQQVSRAMPGQILASRPVILENILDAPGQPWDVDAWQIAFRSNNTQGQPITAVATLIKPRGTSSTPRPLLDVNMPENSNTSYCAPSYAMRYRAAIPSLIAGQVFVQGQTRFITNAVARGYAVIVPDDEGPNSAYSAGILAAHITLDGIRAATRFAPLEVGTGGRVAMIGYSGGATGVSRAVEMATSYAPDLNIVGAAEGGIMVDAQKALTEESGTIATGYALASVMGTSTEYPEIAAYYAQNANPGVRWLASVKRPLCGGLTAWVVPFLDLRKDLNYENSGGLAQRIFDNESLGKASPDIPLFIWHSRYDEFFNIADTDRLISFYCRNPNASIEYYRDSVPGHILTGVDGGSAAALWAFARLRGEHPAQGCWIQNVSSMSD